MFLRAFLRTCILFRDTLNQVSPRLAYQNQNESETLTKCLDRITGHARPAARTVSGTRETTNRLRPGVSNVSESVEKHVPATFRGTIRSGENTACTINPYKTIRDKYNTSRNPYRHQVSFGYSGLFDD